MSDPHDLEQAGEGVEMFEPGESRDEAHEAIAATHLLRQDRLKGGRRQGTGKGAAAVNGDESRNVLKRAFDIVTAPIMHYVRNIGTVGIVTGIGTASAFGVSKLIEQNTGAPLNAEGIALTAAFAYPVYRGLTDGLEKVGYWIGHGLNAVYRDRYNELRSQPVGKRTGQAAAFVLGLSGGLVGQDYDSAAWWALTVAPTAVADAIVDNTTRFENTNLDPWWDAHDQAGCLYEKQVNADADGNWKAFGFIPTKCQSRPETAGMTLQLQ